MPLYDPQTQFPYPPKCLVPLLAISNVSSWILMMHKEKLVYSIRRLKPATLWCLITCIHTPFLVYQVGFSGVKSPLGNAMHHKWERKEEKKEKTHTQNDYPCYSPETTIKVALNTPWNFSEQQNFSEAHLTRTTRSHEAAWRPLVLLIN